MTATTRVDASAAGAARVRVLDTRAAMAVATIFVVAVVAAFLLPQWGVLTPDTKPELYLNPSRMLGRELSAWRPVPFLGSPNYHPGIAPVTAVVWGLQALGAAPWLSQRLLAVLLTLLGAAGAAVLVRRLAGQGTPLVPLVAGIAYALHPYAIVAGATLPIRLPHAVLPWFVLATVFALRRGTWRGMALATLAYAAMGGINGGIVNLLLALSVPVAAVVVARTDRVSPRQVWRRVAALAGLCVLVSLYWVVPTLLAAGSTATDVAATTEAPTAVAVTSSPIESLRGLGLWTLYLVIGGRPEVPGHVGYLTNGWLVAATLGLPVLAAMGVAVHRSRLRLLAAGLLVVALPIMVGLYPPDGSSPLGRLLAWAFQHVPAAIGFRTTNKAGSLLALGVAILVGMAAAGQWRRRSLAPLVLVVVGVAALPVWLGRAQPVTLDVPDYWRQAAADLDTDDPGRLLFAPGAFLARYDWGYGGVDDLDTALFDRREVVWRPTVPAGSRPAHSLLTAFDVGMNTDGLSPEAANAYLSLLGVSDVLVRADSENPLDGAATAAGLLRTYTAIDGADVTRTWGPDIVQHPPLASPAPPTPALTQVAMPTNQPSRVTPLRGNLVVTGDAFAIGHLADAGYRPQDRSIAWLDDLPDDELHERLEAGGRLVLTDTNQRRRWDVRGLDRSHSTVLDAGDPLDPAESRVRSTDPATQTTAFLQGGIGITSSDDSPGLLRINATTPPSFAADGDPNTSWLTGAFNSERDSWIRLDYGTELPLDTIRVVVDTSLDRVISRLRITTDDEDVVVDVPHNGVVLLGRFGQSRWIRVDVLAARGAGQGPVGITDISVGGRSIRKGLALPDPVVAPAGGALASAVGAAPVDVVMTRLQGRPDVALDDEEGNLLRVFTLPGDRTVSVTATVRPNSPPDHLLDAAALPDFDGTITSPTPTEAGPLGRATQAFDDDPDTAWRPLGPGGEVTVTLPEPAEVTEVVVRREPGAGPALLRLQTDEQDREVALVGSRTRFLLAGETSTTRVTFGVVAPGLAGQVPPILDISAAGIRTRPITPSTRLAGCAALGRMDGDAVWVQVDASVRQLVSGEPLTVDGCSTLRLGPGRHQYDAGFGWPVDQLVLRSRGESATPPGADWSMPPEDAGTVRVLAATRTSRRLTVSTERAAILSTGIAWDPRWQASLGGRSLGPPVMTAGYAVGWPVPPGTHELSITYAPQTPVRAGMIASGAIALVLLAVAVTGSRRRP